MYKVLTHSNKPNFSRLYSIGGKLKSTLAKGNVQSTAQDAARALLPGTKLHGYTVHKVEEVPELFLTTVALSHDQTGAKHLHVARDDDNNTFSVAFKTTPMDSTGVPHILEHTVLCGSKKFPVRDPFFKMLNRSLATFMNAFTASDWTMYPFSTQNRKDYNNLLSIYLDAVFYPQLRQLDFSQEGWRLEHENVEDKNSPISFKGVVYNEMKGVFSSQQNIFAEAVQNKLLPSHTYGVVSGGDPENIPDLTWEHLRNFHQTHYHPSNASAKRKEVYKEFQAFTDTESLKILKHCQTRWLSLEKCVIRLLHQWKALQSYFTSHDDVEKPGRIKRVADWLADPLMWLLCAFLEFVLPFLNEFNTTFQSGESMIGHLYGEMVRLLRKLMGRFVTSKVIREQPDLTKVSYTDINNQHDNERLAVGWRAREYMDNNEVNPEVTQKFFRFFTYGNFPLEEHLQYIHENYLQNFTKINAETGVPCEPRWSGPREEMIRCQPDTMAPDPEKQTTVAVSFLLSDITDIEESTTVSIMSSLLTNGETSPFYQALLEANIGSDYSPVVGYNGYTRESSFSIGLQGIHPDDVERVKQIIEETVDKVIRDGFEQSRIDALLHRVELQTKHQSSNFGLGIVMSVASGWNHDGDASEMLKVNNQIKLFKEKLKKDPQYLQKKVKHYLKDNPHKLTLVMSPDDKFEDMRKSKEQEKLKSCVNKLSEQERDRIFLLGQELQKTQNSVEDLSCLPCIQVSEIDRNIKLEPVQRTEYDGISVQCSAQPTNEVTYIKMVSFLDQVPEEMKIYIPLFTNVITKMGAGSYDYKELSHQVELYTGGLAASPLVVPDPSDSLGFEQGVLFSSYCLERNLDRMLDLWTEIFNHSNLHDSARLQTLIKMSAADLASELANAGHNYAMTHSASSLTPAGKLNEMFGGVTQVSVMKKIAELEDNSKIMDHLIELGRAILNKNNLKMSVNATPDFMPTAIKRVETFVDSLRSDRKPENCTPKQHTVYDKQFEASSGSTQIELPFSVNYMSKSVQTVPYCHDDFAALRILSRLLTWKYLHREIREKGGAYGGGCNCTNGVMSFFSYRDPNSLETLEVFDRSVDWAASGNFSDTDVEEAKITVFQQMNKPVPPGQIGSTLFLHNISDPMRQLARNQLFSVSKDDVIKATQRYLLPGRQPSSLSFLGPENKRVTDSKDWKIIKE